MEVKVPDIGGYSDVPIIELLVADGDSVEADQPLLVLESDKATMEVPAPAAGIVKDLKVKVGDKIAEGTVICSLETGAADASEDDAPAASATPAGEPQVEETAAPQPAATPTAGGGAARTAVNVPDIGDYADVPVIEVLVADGDHVDVDQPLLVLESDKATMEVPSPAAGTVSGLRLKVGDKVAKGDAVCELIGEDDARPDAGGPVETSAAQPSAPPPQESASAAASPPPSGGTQTVSVPDIGDFSDVPVIEVLVADGDTVEAEQPLLVLESDKATMEVPSPGAGTIAHFRLKVGDKVAKGDTVCELRSAGGGAPAAPAAKAPTTQDAPAPAPASGRKPEPSAAAAPATVGSGPAPKSDGPLPHAGPATRKFARELGVDLAQVKGSARHGRITIEDVQGYVKSALKAAPSAAPASAAPAGGAGIPPIPPQDFSKFGEIETVELARIRKLSSAHLHRCWLNVPHVTQTDEADITELEAFRKAMSDELVKTAGGPKLTLLPFVMMAVGAAMKAYPEFNSSLAPDGGSLIMKKYCHIGFAADTPNGLVVPVVRDVWRKGLKDLAAETAELARKARDGKLKPADMSGGCFSISSLGGIGGSHFTPIVNAPEVGILGVSRAQMKPVWDGKAFQPRLMAPLSLSYDHRVIDGAYAARFIVLLTQLLGDVRRLVL